MHKTGIAGFVGVLVGAAFTAVVSMWQPFTAKSLKTEELRIVDATGETRVLLSPSGVGMYDENGRVRAALSVGVTKGDVGLLLCDENARARMSLLVSPKGEDAVPSVVLLDAGGQLCGSFEVSTAGEPLLTLRDNTGQSRAILGVSHAGPALSLLDSSDNIRAALGTVRVTTDGGAPEVRSESSLVLRDGDGTRICQMP